MKRIIPMADAICNGPPPSFVREDIGVAATFARYFTKLKSIPGGPQKLSEPFSTFLEDAEVLISESVLASSCNLDRLLHHSLPHSPSATHKTREAARLRHRNHFGEKKGGETDSEERKGNNTRSKHDKQSKYHFVTCCVFSVAGPGLNSSPFVLPAAWSAC